MVHTHTHTRARAHALSTKAQCTLHLSTWARGQEGKRLHIVLGCIVVHGNSYHLVQYRWDLNHTKDEKERVGTFSKHDILKDPKRLI